MLKHIRIQLEQATYAEGLHIFKGLIKYIILYANLSYFMLYSSVQLKQFDWLPPLDLGSAIFQLTGVSLSVESTDRVFLTYESRVNLTLIFRARNLIWMIIILKVYWF